MSDSHAEEASLWSETLTCPWCGHEEDTNEWDAEIRQGADAGSFECEECSRRFRVEVEYSAKYRAFKG